MYLLYPFPNPMLSENPLEAMQRMQQSWFDNGLGVFNYWQAWMQDAQTVQSGWINEYLAWCEKFAGFSLQGEGGVPQLVEQVEMSGIEAAVDDASVVDDLTLIQGVGKVLAERLNAAGICSFQQIVDWDADEIARIEEEVLGSRFNGRVARDQWQVQAEALAVS